MAERTIGRAELVRQLGVSPRLVRELLRRYHGWLSNPESGRFTALDLARLQIVARGRIRGLPSAEIESMLLVTRRQGEEPRTLRATRAAAEQTAGEAAAAQEPDAATPALPEPVATELARLHRTLADSVERERRDRDRMLTALMRTQQEVSHLRQELGTYRSRKERKRGFMGWLRG